MAVVDDDQGIFTRRDVFEGINAYPEILLMVDVALMRRLKTGRL